MHLYQVKQFTQWVGRSQGISVRIVKGVYYRTGEFRGTPVKSEQAVDVDSGLVALTQHAVYFGGRKKTLKLPYEKVVSIKPYSDGVGLQKDGKAETMISLGPLDGWFTYNLIKTLASDAE